MDTAIDKLRRLAASQRSALSELTEGLELPAEYDPAPDVERDADGKPLSNAQRQRNAWMREWMRGVPPVYEETVQTDPDLGKPITQHVLNGGSCILLGPNGCGKTTWGWQMLSYILRTTAKRGQLCKAIDLLAKAKSQIQNRGDVIEWMLKAYGDLDVLIVDEVDKTLGTTVDYNFLTRLIDYRWEHKLQTVVMGNCTKEEFIYTVGSSAFSRLAGTHTGGRLFLGGNHDMRFGDKNENKN